MVSLRKYDIWRVMTGISLRYARGLFSAAQTLGQEEKVEQTFSDFINASHGSTALKKFIALRGLQSSERSAVIEKIYPGSSSTPARRCFKNFLLVLSVNKRFHVLPSIYRDFHRCYLRYKNIEPATVTSAHKLDSKTLQEIETALKSYFERELEITTDTKEDLVGGLRVRLGSKLYDASLQSRIKNFQLHLEKA